MLDIYSRLLNSGVSMADIDNMDITRYFQVIAREAERFDKKKRKKDEEKGDAPLDWDKIPRVNIDQVKGFD